MKKNVVYLAVVTLMSSGIMALGLNAQETALDPAAGAEAEFVASRIATQEAQRSLDFAKAKLNTAQEIFDRANARMQAAQKAVDAVPKPTRSPGDNGGFAAPKSPAGAKPPMMPVRTQGNNFVSPQNDFAGRGASIAPLMNQDGSPVQQQAVEPVAPVAAQEQLQAPTDVVPVQAPAQQ